MVEELYIHIMKFPSLEELALLIGEHIYEYHPKEGVVIYYRIQAVFEFVTILVFITKEKKEDKWFIVKGGKMIFSNEYKFGYYPIIYVKRDSLLEANLHRILHDEL